MSTGAAAAVSPITLSFEEYLAAYDGAYAEWVDGSVVPMSPSSDRHQDIVDFLGALMRYYAEETEAGVVRTSHVPMRIGPIARIPDVLFLSTAHRDRLKATHVEGPADLVVEVVSPESRARDRGEKFYEYEQAGIREFWLLDPLRETAELFRLDERGHYVPVPTGNPPRLASEVLRGFWIDPAWLWRNPMPTLKSVHKEWGLV